MSKRKKIKRLEKRLDELSATVDQLVAIQLGVYKELGYHGEAIKLTERLFGYTDDALAAIDRLAAVVDAQVDLDLAQLEVDRSLINANRALIEELEKQQTALSVKDRTGLLALGLGAMIGQ